MKHLFSLLSALLLAPLATLQVAESSKQPSNMLFIVANYNAVVVNAVYQFLRLVLESAEKRE